MNETSTDQDNTERGARRASDFSHSLKSDSFRKDVIKAMDRTPKINSVPLPDREKVFAIKVRQCCLLFDFKDPNSELNGKELKIIVLRECIDFLLTHKYEPFRDETYEQVFSMFEINVLRTLPPHQNPCGPPYDPEEDEPVMPPDWIHLQLVYELFIRFFDSNDFQALQAKKFISTYFTTQLLLLFDNEDPRERDMLKTTLHRVYGKFLHLRAVIRKLIGNIFLEFIYEKDRHLGISELLEILGSIINGFAIPLKDEHKLFLEKILLPLHRTRSLSLYYPQLAYCLSQFCQKDPSLREVVILKLLRIWPNLNSSKQVLFLNEIEEIIEGIETGLFHKILYPLLYQLTYCISTQQFQVAERALYYWSNPHFVELLLPNLTIDVFMIVFPVLSRFCKENWNKTLHGLAMNALKIMVDGNTTAFQDFLTEYKRLPKDNQPETSVDSKKTEKRFSFLLSDSLLKNDKSVLSAVAIEDYKQTIGLRKKSFVFGNMVTTSCPDEFEPTLSKEVQLNDREQFPANQQDTGKSELTNESHIMTQGRRADNVESPRDNKDHLSRSGSTSSLEHSDVSLERRESTGSATASSQSSSSESTKSHSGHSEKGRLRMALKAKLLPRSAKFKGK